MNYSLFQHSAPAPLFTRLIRGCIVCALLVGSPTAFAIKKCQDADGRWHYGDTAVDECERSKVTTLDNRGFIRDENEAPKTDEELAAEQASRAKELAAEQQKLDDAEERNRILSVYQTEADIERQLDNQIYSVESNMAVHNVYLKGMNSKVDRLKEKQALQKGKAIENTQSLIDEAVVKIKESEDELKALEAQKIQIMERFAREKELFRSIKEGSDS